MSLKSWNEQMGGLPRKATLIALTFTAAALLWILLPYVWPFACAFVFSRILKPFVRMASKGFLRRLSPGMITAAGMLLLFGLAGALVSVLAIRLWKELSGFVRSLPQLLQWLNDQAVPSVLSLYRRFSALLPGELYAMAENALSALGQSALKGAASLSGWLTSGAWSTAASIPQLFFSLIVTLMGTYYLTADSARIAAFFKRNLPSNLQKRMQLIRTKLIHALVGQLRGQALVAMVVMFFLILTLGLSGVRYGSIIGILIGAADALPLFGAGLILIPWSLLSFLGGQTGLGVMLLCLYAGAVIIRQILEPRIVGKQLGLYPLATMAAMYTGYRLLGFAGLLAGPVMLNLAKAVLDADRVATQDPPSNLR